MAVLVEDVSTDPHAVGILEGVGSCVAAPIICQEQSVGLIYADPGPIGEPLTDLDRDTLAVFAEGFGHALERCVLTGRLQAHADRVLALARSTEASVTELDVSSQRGVGCRHVVKPPRVILYFCGPSFWSVSP